MKATKKSTAGAKPAPIENPVPALARTCRAALEGFLRARGDDAKAKAFKKLVPAIASRLPERSDPPAAESKLPFYEQPITNDQRDRARSYLHQVVTIINTLKTHATEDKGPLADDGRAWWGFETTVEHLALRAHVLANAALLALNDITSAADTEHEDIREDELARRRREGKPETEPEAAVETA